MIDWQQLQSGLCEVKLCSHVLLSHTHTQVYIVHFPAKGCCVANTKDFNKQTTVNRVEQNRRQKTQFDCKNNQATEYQSEKVLFSPSVMHQERTATADYHHQLDSCGHMPPMTVSAQSGLLCSYNLVSPSWLYVGSQRWLVYVLYTTWLPVLGPLLGHKSGLFVCIQPGFQFLALCSHPQKQTIKPRLDTELHEVGCCPCKMLMFEAHDA